VHEHVYGYVDVDVLVHVDGFKGNAPMSLDMRNRLRRYV